MGLIKMAKGNEDKFPANKDSETVYFAKDTKKIYVGDTEISAPEVKSLTQAEYDALDSATKNNGLVYLITD